MSRFATMRGMTNILLIVGSARKGRVADAVTTQIQNVAKEYSDISLSVADLATLDLPFYANEHSPSDPDYTETDERVLAWGKLVAAADAVLFVTPEYNHTLSGIQKNAIDSLFKEWHDKPAGIVAYGWAGGSRSVATMRELAPVVKLDLKDEPAELYFTKDLAPDGSVIDAVNIEREIRKVLESLR